MNTPNRKHIPVLLTASLILFGVIAGYLGSYLVTPEYKSTAHVIVTRAQLENPLFAHEEPKNRWIWLRDGLALEQTLMTDAFLTELTEQNELIKEWFEDVQSSDGHPGRFFSEIRQLIQAEFKGADAYSFVISAREANADIAYFLVESLVKRIQLLVVADTTARFQSALRQMSNRLDALNPEVHKVEIAVLVEAIERLRVSQTLFQAEADKIVQVIQEPYKAVAPAYPSPKSFAVLGGGAGLLVSFLLLFLKAYFHATNEDRRSA